MGPGATTVISVNLVAPLKAGAHQSDFMLLAPDGRSFGLGANNKVFWARITVPEITTVPPTTPADWEGPNPPILVTPARSATIYCYYSPIVTFAWKDASDPSGIAGYELQVEFSENGKTWSPLQTGQTSKLSQDLELGCGYYYRWRVRAQDAAGNWGNFGDFQYFVTEQTVG